MKFNQSGAGLLETIIATAIFGIIMVGFVSSISSLGFTEIKTRLRTDATQAARENAEIAYNLSVRDWADFSTLADSNKKYHPKFPVTGANYVSLEPGEEKLSINNALNRYLVISPVNRDLDGNIVESGGTLDPDTLKIESVVYWGDGDMSETVSFVSYLTNFSTLENL